MTSQTADFRTELGVCEQEEMAGEKIMGFGHAVYRAEDPRGVVVPVLGSS